jgi:hypothetical protein
LHPGKQALARANFNRLLVIGRVLGHQDRTVTSVHYAQHDYLTEKRAALETWGRTLAEIATGKSVTNVVDFQQARA